LCGIAGIYDHNLDRASQDSLIKGMISALQHRGPDGWGTYITPGCVLGHTRLSIIDIEGGNQPFMSERYVIAYNGEVYNYIELRDDLWKEGVKFHTRSDTEVVLRAFEYYGTSCFSKFNGQFALIIWDRREKRIIIARDRYGVRPLYILEHGGSYYFSSEVKAFDYIPGYTRSIDRKNMLNHALLWNTLGSGTVFNDIRSLPGGTYEIYSDGGGVERHRYYEVGESAGTVSPDYESAREEFVSLLNDAVRLRLRSDVPVGTYLSGGIDSSVITYLTKQNKNEKFKSFSVGFDDKEYDESVFQLEMADKLNSDHYMVGVDYTDIDDNYREASYHFERPVFRTAPVPLFLLSRLVREKGITVVLTGEAADEILYGYDAFKELILLDSWKKNPESEDHVKMIRQLYPHLQHYADPRKFGFIKMYYEEFLDSYDNELVGLNIRIRNNAILANVFNKDWNISFSQDELIEEVKTILPDNFDSWTILQKNQFLEMKTLLSGYLLSSQGDRMSMAHGVEGRYPFLDHRLIEKLFYYNDSYKLNGFSQKYILRESFRGIIPDSILDRPKKPYTAPDLQSFFRDGRWSESADYFLSHDRISDYGIFNPRFVERFMGKFEKGLPGEIGYRDNMIISFIISAQMIEYWIKNPKKHVLHETLQNVKIFD